jgi:hypothetical protein
MPDSHELTQQLVADAMAKQLPGLTKTVVVRYFVSNGAYDAESDSYQNVYNDVPGVVCIAAKPTFADVSNYKVVHTSTKCIIPGKFLPSVPQEDTGHVQIDGVWWQITKVVEVPGESVYLVFCARE